MDVVEGKHGGGPEPGGQKGSEHPSGNVSQYIGNTILPRHNRQRGRNQHGLNIWAGRLSKGEIQKIDGLCISGGGWRRRRLA
jgi:hypothetical protein